ncbi:MULTISPECIES: EAL domain-containing protein [Sphingomonas]|uniref:EAL domain-containing protein (Putative c-di-GMP-specific phosphodiesterase class I) n=1 Tax=Sphingomonas trueperi TaxID=53317 RepID=A0A7X6BDN3_9SPHN|nr:MULTISPECIES: EAL domain-containing protein [Sphingomonas]NJB99319.1 EAL domain-containing protein (putative c-di-GMP-specific phosphodiesterase class I) [Sphingomonas trueperi]
MRRICTGCRDGVDFDIPFAMAFQPIVDTDTGLPFAYEALVRGLDGSGACDVLSQVTDANRYAFDQACRVKAIETAMAAGLMATAARLSINFLPNAVYSPVACIQLTLQTARAVAMPLDRLIFEFTENQLIADPEHVATIIDSYKQIGFKVAVDDFGAGHSGLDLFARFAPDEVKLDMALVRGIDREPRRQAIVRAMVGMCRELDTLLIAEGIETAEEAAVLRDLGVRYHQGYWYARPELGALPAITPGA